MHTCVGSGHETREGHSSGSLVSGTEVGVGPTIMTCSLVEEHLHISQATVVLEYLGM